VTAVDLSVIVPCYNVETYLDQALSSIETSVRHEMEVIVVNDGSTDGSLAIMRAHEAADPHVRVIDKPNQGYGASVNRGLDEARGTYVAILEPDDYIRPGGYDMLLDLTASQGDPDIVKSAYWDVLMPGTPQEHVALCSFYHRILPDHQPFVLADCPQLIEHHPSIWSALYRADFLRGRGIRLMEVPGAGWVDNPFLMETMLQATSIAYTDEAFYCYRRELPGSSSSNCPPALMFARWNDMADVVLRLHVDDPYILASFYTRGFYYAALALRQRLIPDNEIRDMMQGMFSRMDERVVLSAPFVPNSSKRLYFETMGKPVPHLSRIPYLRAVSHELVALDRTYGARAVRDRLSGFVSRRGGEAS
jgi:glycosyltransferase involved in cell wall biosynthesis